MGREAIKSFKDLIVWQKSMTLVSVVYELTKQFPRSELFGLTSQMRRCAVSIPSNIAEGYKRKNRKEYSQFLGIANGSAAELETQLLIVKIEYPKCKIEQALQLVDEIQAMLTTLIQKLK